MIPEIDESETEELLKQAATKANYQAIALTLGLVVFWPLPMHFSGGVFTSTGFTIWIVCAFSWVRSTSTSACCGSDSRSSLSPSLILYGSLRLSSRLPVALTASQSLSSSLKQSWLICSAQAMLAAVVIVFLAPYQMCCARDSKEEPDKDSPPAEA